MVYASMHTCQLQFLLGVGLGLSSTFAVALLLVLWLLVQTAT